MSIKKLLMGALCAMAMAGEAFALTDSEYIENLIRDRKDGTVVIEKRNLPDEPERDWWLIDRAILVPDQTTIVLKDCKIKLSDKCRDNFFRSANCGFGLGDPSPFKNIEIRGEGFVELEGADYPRATGDGGKILKNPCPKGDHALSYGTDADKPGVEQKGDWRGIGILMAKVDGLKISGLKISESHGWAISLEACTHAQIRDIDFNMCMMRVIDGIETNFENQDGIDIRNGCSDILIENITGTTGDDVIALTAIATHRPNHKGGTFDSTHVMHSDWSRRERGIKNVVIRNVAAHSAGWSRRNIG